jgi:hypothetical protein
LGVILAAAVAVIVWRLQVQQEMQATDKQVVALLASADKLIQEDHDDEAEATARRALGMLPGDIRCQAMIDRIETKRELIRKKKAAASDLVMARAEQLATTDIAAALETLAVVRTESSFTPEAKKAAADRIKELKGGVCTLRLPEDLPADAVLTIDEITQTPKKGIVSDIVHGKHTIAVKRFGFRDSPAMELDFQGLEPVRLPAIVWKIRGAKVFVTSTPAGAAVWRDGKDTGKVTPCDFDDVDDGTVEFLLKHPARADTPAKGEVKDRQPTKLSVTLEPKA